MGTPGSWFLNAIPTKRIKGPWRKGWFSGAGKMQAKPGTSCVRIKEVLKNKQKTQFTLIGEYQRSQEPTEKVPNGQSWNYMSSKINAILDYFCNFSVCLFLDKKFILKELLYFFSFWIVISFASFCSLGCWCCLFVEILYVLGFHWNVNPVWLCPLILLAVIFFPHSKMFQFT